MPQAVGMTFAMAVASIGAGTAVATAAFYVGVVATYAAGAYLLNKASQALMPGAPKNKGAGYEVNYAGTDSRRKLIYGEVDVGGMQVIPPVTSGTDGRYLHFVLALAGHEVDSISHIHFDRDLIASADIGVVTGTDADGVVGNANKYADIAWIRRYTGTASQSVDYILTQAYPTEFDGNFRGRGIAYLAIRLKYKEKVYSGVPGVVATVRGKWCWDPRMAPPQSVWTQNPALIARDYLINEVGYTTDEIDDTSVIAAANICDQTVTVPTSTDVRYQCNVMLEAASEPSEWEENLRTIVDTMRGRAVQRDGKWYLYAGAWEVPAVAIDTADWIGPTTVRASAPPDERWNAVRVWYVDENRDYQRVECYPRRNLGYETMDGGDRIWLELELPGVTNEYEAQRHGEFALRASRNQLTVTGTLRPEFFKLATWDTVTVTDSDYGWGSKTFRVAAMDLTPTGEVSVTLVEEGAATWTDLIEAEYNAVSVVSGIDPGASVPEQRTDLVVTPDFAAIGFMWQRPQNPLPGEQTRLIEKDTQGSPWLGTEVWRGASTGVVLGKSDTTTRFYWIQGIVGSYEGLYTPFTSSGYPAAADPLAYAPVSAILAPSHIALPADSTGFVPDYTPANGVVRISHGYNWVSSLSNYAVSSAAGVVGTVNTADNSPWSGQPRGAYRVTNCTSDIGVLWITATYSAWYGPLPYLLPFTVIKQRFGNDGTDGEAGPPGTNIVVNGLMDTAAIDGTLTGWNAPSAATSGYSGGRCLVLGAAGASIEHSEYIPVDPEIENLGISLKVRQVTSGSRTLYVGLACYDEYFQHISAAREAWRSWLMPVTDSNSSAIRVHKPATTDGTFPGYYGTVSLNTLILTHSPCISGSYHSNVTSFAAYPGRFYECPVSSIDTSNSSYDTLTLQSALPVPVFTNQVVGLGTIGSTHKYAYIAPPRSNRWESLSWLVAGTIHPIERFRADEPYSLRHGTRYVRPYLYSAAGAGDVMVDDFVMWRVGRNENNLFGDVKLESSGRFRFRDFDYDVRSLCAYSSWPIQFHPSSGPSGNGVLVFTNQSARGGTWSQLAQPTMPRQRQVTEADPFFQNCEGLVYKVSFKLWRHPSNTGGKAVILVGNAEGGSSITLTDYPTGEWVYVERLVAPDALATYASVIKFGADYFNKVTGGLCMVADFNVQELAGGGPTWQRDVATSPYYITLDDNTRRISFSVVGGVVYIATANYNEAAYTMQIGSWLEIYNATSNNISVQTNGTLRLAGTATTGTRIITQRGLAVLNKVGATEWTIHGAGVS